MSAIFRSLPRYPRHVKCSGVVLVPNRHVSGLSSTVGSLNPLADQRRRQERASGSQQGSSSYSCRFLDKRSGYQVRHFVGLNSEKKDCGRHRGIAGHTRSFSTYSSKSRKGGIMSDLEDSELDLEDFEDDDREFGIDPDEEARRKKEQERLELKKVFLNRKGRGWSDPMDMEPIYEANLKWEDVPEWSPEGVSTVSRERVQIHPDKIPTLFQLARLPLPVPVHPCPGDGKFKAYALHRQRLLQKRVAVAVRNKAKERVTQIQVMTSWDDKQKAVDELFESIDEELRNTEIILGRQPMFGEWVEKALEQYLVEVDETSKNNLYQQVATDVKAVVDPQVKSIEELPTLDAKLSAAHELFGTIGTQAELDSLGSHPLLGQLLIQAMEDCLSDLKKEAEEALYKQVAEIVRAKASVSVDAILSSEDQNETIEKLAESIKDEHLEEFDGKRYNFVKWLMKTHEDFLYQKIASAVRSDEALYSDMSEIDDPETQRKLINYRAKILKQQLEQENFPLAKHERFVNWTKRALEESLDVSQNNLYQQLESKVVAKVSKEDEERIRAISTGDEKWAALDDLTEYIVRELGAEDLAGHYQYERWVRRALKEHLQKVEVLPGSNDVFFEEKILAPLSMVKRALEELVNERNNSEPYPTRQDDEKAVPIFMDCFGPGCGEEKNQNVPDILRPLKFFNDRVSTEGKMIEEWELAAHKETKRIMLRESTRHIAQIVEQGETTPRRILVHGKQGVGKTAALAAIVASARKSGHIVYYMPDTRMLHEHGYYNEPNKKRPGIFDLPILSQHQCQIMLDSHRDDFEGISAVRETMEKYFSEKRMEVVGESLSLVEILELGAGKESAAAACFSCAMDVLMNQEVKPFTMVVDEFNVLFSPGKYFNMEYDESVNDAIPYNQINLFKPILDAAGINTRDNGATFVQTPVLMKKGSILIAFTEGHAVSPKVTGEVMTNAKLSTKEPTYPLVIIEIPRLSKLEVEHMLSNYEAIGMGKLRLDGGETVTNPHEVEYLRMVSSANPQKLLNACIMP